MRIGIYLICLQTPSSRRGMGRYARSLVNAMLRVGAPHEFVLYYNEGFPQDDFPDLEGLPVKARYVGIQKAAVGGLERSVQELVDHNPDALDWFLISSSFEALWNDYQPPYRPFGKLKIATVFYDLVPLLYPQDYLPTRVTLDVYLRGLRAVRTYDLLLAISEATKADGERMLGMPGNTITTISSASDPTFFRPPRPEEKTAGDEAMARLGVAGPYVMSVVAEDARKNSMGLIRAFADLPDEVRATHQLVIACRLPREVAEKLRAEARRLGIDKRMLLTGHVSDDELRFLYQRCAVYILPSHYEGFGLPLLEAMLCGAPVIGGNNSSQIEVVGDGGLLVDTHNIAAITHALARVLGDPALAASLKEKGLKQARAFSWEHTGRLAIAAMERASAACKVLRDTPPLRAGKGGPATDGARLAVVSPWSPLRMGVCEASERLVREWQKDAVVDRFHDPAYLPTVALEPGGVGCFDQRLFYRRSRLFGYHGVLYQMGDGPAYGRTFEGLGDRPGVVALHDFSMAAFSEWYALWRQSPGWLANELETILPKRTDADGLVRTLRKRHGSLAAGLSAERLWMNHRVFKEATHVVVHCPWHAKEGAKCYPQYAAKIRLIPPGADVLSLADAARQTARERYGLDAAAFLIGCPGGLNPNRRTLDVLRAFAGVAAQVPGAMLAFTGETTPGPHEDAAVELIESLGLHTHVKRLGAVGDEAERLIMASCDAGVCAGERPWDGQTLIGLTALLAGGVATVADAGMTQPEAVAELPDGATPEVITAALVGLAKDRARREALATAARQYVEREATWPHVAALYRGVMEESNRMTPTGATEKQTAVGA